MGLQLAKEASLMMIWWGDLRGEAHRWIIISREETEQQALMEAKPFRELPYKRCYLRQLSIAIILPSIE